MNRDLGSLRGPVALLLVLLVPQLASAQEPSAWTFGIGTGLQRLNAKGDVGFTSARGAETGSIDLTPEDFNDLMESAFGFQAFAAKGKWRFNLTYGNLALEDKSQVSILGLPALTTTFKQDVEFGEITAAYQIATLGAHHFGVLGGVRTTRHDYSLTIAPPPNSSAGTLRRNLDDDWTDVLLGLTHAVALSDKVSWNNSVAVGFGGSDSYWSARSALGWQFARSWNAGLFIEYRNIDFENGNPGDNDWYLYDVDEWGPGISIAYVFH
ncbi:MAG: hypothetical protein R3E86_04005 [Pseudomonadales bacterium]